MRITAAVALALLTAGCITTTGGDTVNFRPKPNQEAIVRDGDTIITSRAKYSVVTMRAANHLVAGRPVFIVGIQNISKNRLDFRLSDSSAGQVVDGSTNPLRVYTYDEIVAQEKSEGMGRDLAARVLGVSSNGTNLVLDTGNGEAAAASQEANKKNMEDIEQLALKDRTLMPGEDYAGKLYLQAPADSKDQKNYFIDLKVGPDQHEFQIVQTPLAR